MRTVSGGNLHQPISAQADLTDVVRIEVADDTDALVDLSDFAVSLEYDQSVDEIVDGAVVVFRRLEGVNSLAPLMTATPPVALGRRIVVSINPGSGTYTEVFRGRITDVDWPERFGDVTVQCLDQAGVAARAWIRTARPYGSTAGVSLETVMQAVADDNLVAPYTLYFPAPTGAVVQHLVGDPPYGPTEQSVLDALRALAESYGGTARWRHFGASASDWRWTVFSPSRSKTVPDHTFGTSDYWDVTTMKQSDEDIRNMIEVEWMEDSVRNSITVSDAPSIAKYNGGEPLYAKLTEGSDSPVNNETLATALANAALSDLKEPDAILEITGRYFWPGEIGVDLYRFTANNKHFSTDQDLAAMRFSHRIAVGERPTTKILTRGKPSGGVLMWRRRLKLGSLLPLVPEMRVSNFREVARTDTTVTFGWDVAGTVTELWLYLSTPAQPVATDPWAVLTGVPSARLTAATVEYTVSIPDAGLVTYGRLVPIDADVARGQSWDFTVQGAAVSLIQRATIQSTSPTQIVVRVAVANPIPGGNVTIAYAAGGLTVTPASGQVITAASVTTDLATTGTVDFTITRPAFGSGTGRVTFTATATDRVADTDAVDVPAQERDTQGVSVRIRRVSETADQIVVRVDAITPNVGATVTVSYDNGGLTVSPSSGGTFTSTTDFGTTNYIDYTITRDAQGGSPRRVSFTLSATGFIAGTDGVDVMPKGERFRCKLNQGGTPQNIVHIATTTLLWSTEVTDVGGLHSTSSNTGRITIPAGGNTGFWVFNFAINLTAGASVTWMILRLVRNGATDEYRIKFPINVNGSDGGGASVLIADAAVSDYFEVTAQLDGGGGDTTATGGNTFFEAIHVF